MQHQVLLFLTASTISTSLALAMTGVGCGGSSSSTKQDSGAPGADSGTTMIDSGTTTEAGSTEASVQDGGAPETGMALECTLPDGGFPPGYPAMHSPYPQVGYGGGGLLLQPEVVTVTFLGETLAPQLEAFGDNILNSCWWDTVRAGYCEGANGAPPCIGRGVVPSTPHVELTTQANASYTDAEIQQFIQQEVANGGFPAPDAGTIYVIYFPGSTSINYGGALTCSSGILGYHGSVSVTPPGGSATNTTYAVLPECNYSMFGFGSLLDELTFDASHEITESSTDPFSGFGMDGYLIDFNNQDNYAWEAVFPGGEIGDMCENLVGAPPHNLFTAQAGGTSYLTQRMWSIGQAALGGDPCAPIGPDDTPYFNVSIAAGSGFQALSVGGSVTFQATAYSSAPLAPWNVIGLDYTSLTSGTHSSITVTIDDQDGGVASTVTNGQTVNVTVTLNSMPSTEIGQGVYGAAFLILSQSGDTYHYWPGLVVAE